jgi:hypothetical protein
MELICCCILFNTFLEQRKIKKALRLLILVIAWVGLFGIACIDQILPRILLGILFLIFIMRYLYLGKWKSIILMTVLYYGYGLSIDILMLTLQQLVTHMDRNQLLYTNSISTPIAGRLLMLITTMAIFLKFSPKASLDFDSKKEWLIFFVYSAILCLIVFGFVFLPSELIQFICVIGFLLVENLFFCLIQIIIKREKKVRELNMSELQAKSQLRIYQSMEENYAEQQTKIH